MLILFKGNIVEGFWDGALKVFELADEFYIVETGGKRYICSYWREAEVEKGIVIDELQRCEYKGSYKEGIKTFHVYCVGREYICIEVTDDNKMSRKSYSTIKRVQFGDVDIYCDNDFSLYKTENHVFANDLCKNYSIAVNRNNGNVIHFESYVAGDIFEQAERAGKIEVLQKLSTFLRKRIDNIGRYNLNNFLRGEGVSFEKMCEELGKVDVQELLFAGISRTRMNFNRAVGLMDKVKPWKGDYSDFKVEVNGDFSVNIRRDNCLNMVWFGRFKRIDEPSGNIDYKLRKVLELCKKYPLTCKLDDKAIRQWARFLKALEPQKIKYCEY